MNYHSLLYFLVLCVAVNSWKTPEEYVEYVERDDLEVYVAKHPLVLVHWYASWCSFCKEFAPTWSAMTDIVVEGGNDFKMIKVEVGDDNEWKAAYGIDIVPDFGVFVNNQYYHFNGKKEAGDLLHFVVNRTDDSILKVSNKEQIEFIQEKGNALMIGLFNEGSNEESIFKKNVFRDRNCLFILPSPEVRDSLLESNSLQIPSILALKSFDEFIVKYSESFTNEDVHRFIDYNSHPVVYPTRNVRYTNYLYSHNQPWMTLLIDKKDAPFPSSLSRNFLEMCKTVRESVCFYIGKDEKNRYDFYTEGKHLKFPVIITVHHIRGYHFKYYFPPLDRETVETLTQYQENILQGIIKPELLSEKPAKNDLLYLKTAIGSTFEEEVMNSKEDCVVQFYSDSCDHCTKMMKRFEKVASLFADDNSIKFFKFSSNTNDIDIEGIYAKYFHSVLYFHKSNPVQIIEYPRSRKVWRTKSLAKWIVNQKESFEGGEEEKEEDEL